MGNDGHDTPPQKFDLRMGDCLELMRELPDASVELILCDLPYGTTQCRWDAIVPLKRLWAQYRRIIKPEGVIVLTAAQPFTSALVMSNPDWFRYDLVWEKSKASGFLNAKRQPLRAHESILIFSNRAPPYFPQMEGGKAYDKGVRKAQTDNDVYGRFCQARVKSEGARYPRSVLKFKTAEREGGHHKAQKPIALMEYLVRTYTSPGDMVLDNCMGSGTTGVACAQAGRRFIGMEMDAGYFEIARNRIEAAYALENDNG